LGFAARRTRLQIILSAQRLQGQMAALATDLGQAVDCWAVVTAFESSHLKFEIPKNSLFATLLRSPWWISMAIAAALAVLAATLLPAQYKAIGSMSTLPFVVIGAIAARRQWRLPSAAQVARTQQALATMAWPQFAALLEDAFRRDGYAVQRGAATSVDFVIERKGRRAVVCARRWKSACASLVALRSLQAAREAADAPDAIYICLGDLTNEARPFAKQHGIAIWQSAELAQALKGAVPHPSAAK
jgi:restriction system protein